VKDSLKTGGELQFLSGITPLPILWVGNGEESEDKKVKTP